MLRNYFKIGLRHVLREKFYSAINVLGLALGLTLCLLVGLYISDELGFDRFHKDADNLYEVGLRINFGGQEITTASSSKALAPLMRRTIPGVEQSLKCGPWKDVAMRYKERIFTEGRLLRADSNFFSFFNFPLLQGDRRSVLNEPHSIVLTPNTARKYFGDQPAMGKTVLLGEDQEAFKVTGIAQEPPDNSSIQFDAVVSSNFADLLDWDIAGLYTFYRKNPKTAPHTVEAGLRSLVLKYVAPEIESNFDVPFFDFEKNGGVFDFFSYPLTGAHLNYPEIQDGPSAARDIRYVYILGTIGIAILLISCINFINLTTARSSRRAREVGLRKTLGSSRFKLMTQFMTESFLFVLTAVLVAGVTVYVLLPEFNLLSGKSIRFVSINSPAMVIGIGAIVVLVTFLSGVYPSLYLSSFRPIEILKGPLHSGRRSGRIRSVLVVLQFTISIALMIGTLVIYQQLHFMQEQNLGLNKDNVLMIEHMDRLGTQQTAFKDELDQNTGIVGSSYVNTLFPTINAGANFHGPGSSENFLFPTYGADYDHLSLLKLTLLQGRNFSRSMSSDSSACLLNESAVKQFGWGDPVGQKIISYGKELHVIGVVKNFNFESLKSRVKPLVIRLDANADNLLVRYRDNPKDAVAATQALWRQIAPSQPFDFSFLDQQFDRFFREEMRIGQLFTVLASIAIFIACLGLLGLAAFTAEQRTKEIGIRKVMGASVRSIHILLARQFMGLVLLSFIIATVGTWYAAREWLMTFAYRVNPAPAQFLAAGLLACLIAWITVSYHFNRAAGSNPVDALKYE